MMIPINWINVTESTIVTAIAYDDAAERIFVRLHSGVEFYFDNCDPALWNQFKSPAHSKGEFIKNVLENHAYGRWLRHDKE
jgi:hypothetical protein